MGLDIHVKAERENHPDGSVSERARIYLPVSLAELVVVPGGYELILDAFEAGDLIDDIERVFGWESR